MNVRKSISQNQIEVKFIKDSMLIIITFALGARRAMRAAAALPALFSSTKLIVELMRSKTTIPTKSCQSGGFPCEEKEILDENHLTFVKLVK